MGTYASSPRGQSIYLAIWSYFQEEICLFSPFIYLYSQAFIYIIIESLILFYIWSYITVLPILLKLFWLWLFGAWKEMKLKVGTCVLLTYSLNVVLFVFILVLSYYFLALQDAL